MLTVESHYGAFIVRGGDYGRGEGTLVQVDYDFPHLAMDCGWNIRRVQPGKNGARLLQRAPNRGKGCDHRWTDGTVGCECGVTASEFIGAAGAYLDSIAL